MGFNSNNGIVYNTFQILYFTKFRSMLSKNLYYCTVLFIFCYLIEPIEQNILMFAISMDHSILFFVPDWFDIFFLVSKHFESRLKPALRSTNLVARSRPKWWPHTRRKLPLSHSALWRGQSYTWHCLQHKKGPLIMSYI